MGDRPYLPATPDITGDRTSRPYGLVETDSWRWHRSRDAFERDRQRDALHARAGYRTLRFTHRQLTTAPDAVAATLHAALNAGTPTA